jgi:hypothetical protein
MKTIQINETLIRILKFLFLTNFNINENILYLTLWLNYHKIIAQYIYH